MVKYILPRVVKIKILDYFSKHPYIVDRVSKKNGDVVSKYHGLMADQALIKLINDFDFISVLDIGSGEGRHSKIFLENGKKVTALDYGESIYFKKSEGNQVTVTCDYMNFKPKEKFDCVWASHVLEHQPNPNAFLSKIKSDLKEGGVVAITVPPLKQSIVGGHVNLYNSGLLLYQMVLAGFDCSSASIYTYGYNISIIVRNVGTVDLSGLTYDSGDIRYLSRYFPVGVREMIGSGDSFDGELYNINW
ncbi:class I SAM-dependent methyltransferase [Parasalinivibrio latis]|uniref:class I SAM-dependent methyltransferase n=1 Tax=Parasalinivibrio latis TaxID=2952610 RepID=UPI003DA671EF